MSSQLCFRMVTVGYLSPPLHPWRRASSRLFRSRWPRMARPGKSWRPWDDWTCNGKLLVAQTLEISWNHLKMPNDVDMVWVWSDNFHQYDYCLSNFRQCAFCFSDSGSTLVWTCTVVTMQMYPLTNEGKREEEGVHAVTAAAWIEIVNLSAAWSASQSDQLLNILLELSLVFTGHSLLACSFTSQLCTSRVFPCASAIFWSMEPQAKPLASCGCVDTSDGFCAALSYSEHDSPWSVDNLCQVRSSEVRFIDGCYTPLAIERLCEEIADSGGSNLSRAVFEARWFCFTSGDETQE